MLIDKPSVEPLREIRALQDYIDAATTAFIPPPEVTFVRVQV